ncbi:putative holin-like toxin [Xylocopilactobacillus apis]
MNFQGGGAVWKYGTILLERIAVSLTVFQAISLMISFGLLVATILKHNEK